MPKVSAAKTIVSALKKSDLSIEDRSLLISAILDKLAAIPLTDIIVFNEEGNLFVNGRKVTNEEQINLRESASAVLNSKAFQLIQQQVVYASFVQAAHTAPTTEHLMFAKAAIWWGQQEDKYLKLLSPEYRNGNLAPTED